MATDCVADAEPPGESGPRTSRGRGEMLLIPMGGDGQGAEMTAALPDGKTRVSAAMLVATLVVLTDEEAPVTIEDPRGDGLKTGELSGDEVAVGGRCCVMASCRRHFTSSAVDKSSGVCPSWFFMCGSAPWAKSKAQSCVRPFWAAS